MTTTRRASASWKGSLSKGSGEVSFDSSKLGAFPFAPALGDEGAFAHTSPMELLAAAHAACVCGMVAHLLDKSGHPCDLLETSAEVGLDPREGITGIHIVVRGSGGPASDGEFAAAVEHAKRTCPVSKALAGTKLCLEIEGIAQQP